MIHLLIAPAVPFDSTAIAAGPATVPPTPHLAGTTVNHVGVRSGFARVIHMVVILMTMILWAPGGSRAHADTWTNLEGDKTLQGDFLGMWQGKVVLRLTNGSKVAIEMEKLNAVSRLHAEDLEEQKQERLAQRVAELAAAPAEEVAPMPTATADAPYEPLPADADLETTIHHVIDQMRAGHAPQALWDALPATYQTDIQTLVQLSFKSTDAEMHVASLGLLEQLARTMNKQRDHVLGYPMLTALPAEAVEKMRNAYTPIVGIIAAVGDAQTFPLEDMQSGDLSAVIARFDAGAGPFIATLLDSFAEETTILGTLLRGGAVTVKMDDENSGSLTMTDAEDKPVTQTFVRVEGRWVPREIAASWKQNIAQAQQELSRQEGQAEASNLAANIVITTAGAILSRIEQAESQEEFNEVVGEYTSLLMQQISQSGSGFPGGPAGYGPAFGPASGPAYGPPPSTPPLQPNAGPPDPSQPLLGAPEPIIVPDAQ